MALSSLFHLFTSDPEAYARNAQTTEEHIRKEWDLYLPTLPLRQDLLRKMPTAYGERKALCEQYLVALASALATSKDLKKADQSMISDILVLEENRKVKKVSLLRQQLKSYETRYHYTFELLRNLYAQLISQTKTCQKIAGSMDLKKYRAGIELLNTELILEEKTVSMLSEMRTIHKIFADLATGEHVIKSLTAKERRIAALFTKKMDPQGTTRRLIRSIMSKIEDRVAQFVAEGKSEDIENADYHFVNGHEFVPFVGETVRKLRTRDLREATLTAFIHAFRNYYNSEARRVVITER